MYFVTNRICIRYTDHWNDNVNKPRNLNRVIGLKSISFQHFKMLHYLSDSFFRIFQFHIFTCSLAVVKRLKLPNKLYGISEILNKTAFQKRYLIVVPTYTQRVS